MPGTSSACHPSIPDTLLPGHTISLTPYLTLTLSRTLSHSDPMSFSPYFAHTLISLSPSHSHPISLSPYLCVTLLPLCPGSDGGDAGAGTIPHRDGHRAGAISRPEGQLAGASEHAQTHPRHGNSLACMHASPRFVMLVFLSFSSDL